MRKDVISNRNQEHNSQIEELNEGVPLHPSRDYNFYCLVIRQEPTLAIERVLSSLWGSRVYHQRTRKIKLTLP